MVREHPEPIEVVLAQRLPVEDREHAEHLAAEHQRLRGKRPHRLAPRPFRIRDPFLVAAHVGQQQRLAGRRHASDLPNAQREPSEPAVEPGMIRAGVRGISRARHEVQATDRMIIGGHDRTSRIEQSNLEPRHTMNRIAQIDPANATGKAKQLLDAVQTNFGIVPNLTRVLANAPAALEGYLGFSGALAHGTLGAKVREQIALAIAEGNNCGYCLSAHTFHGGKAGLSEAEIGAARHTESATAKTNAILKLALAILVQRGEISDGALRAARTAGLTDGEIVETTAHVALNIFTNYINHVARTVVDFPEVKPGEIPVAA